MRFSSEDEHVTLYGKRTRIHNQRTITSSSSSSTQLQVLLKTFTGIYGYVDPNNNIPAAGTTDGGSTTMPYPCLPVHNLIQAFEEPKWQIESLRISHVQLVGNRLDFIKLASCIAQCDTLKSVILGDSRTSQLLLLQEESNTTSTSTTTITTATTGFDAIVMALAQSVNLQEVSIQNMREISCAALGTLCTSTSIEKLQLLLSQSYGEISGEYIHSMAQQLSSNRTNLKELRIFGVLEEDACTQLANMLLVNQTIQKIAIKIKLHKKQPPPQQQQQQHETRTIMENSNSDSIINPIVIPPILFAVQSPSCCLTSMELYLSGSRKDVEACADPFRDALRANRSLRQLNIILYGLDRLGGGAGSPGTAATVAASFRTNELWMERLEEALESNYSLLQVMINHGLLELSEKAKLYVRLNRAGRGALLGGVGKGRRRGGDNNNHSHRSEDTSISSTSSSAAEVLPWVETLARVKNDISCLFYFVSSAPTLLCGGQQQWQQQHYEISSVVTTEEAGSLPLKRKR